MEGESPTLKEAGVCGLFQLTPVLAGDLFVTEKEFCVDFYVFSDIVTMFADLSKTLYQNEMTKTLSQRLLTDVNQ